MEGENFMLEKLKQIISLFVSFYDYLVQKSPEIKAEALSTVENLKENMDQVITPEVRAKAVLKGEDLMETIVDKLKEFFLLLENFNWELVEKLDLVMPHWIRHSDFYENFKVGFPLVIFIISVIVLMVVLNCCYKCLCCCCCGSSRSRSRRVKMMRAPGRSEYLMPRYEFENNPRSYFLDLRGNGGPPRSKKGKGGGTSGAGYNYTLLDP